MSVSVEQLTALMDYLEANPELALGRFNRSKEGSSLARRLWEDCAQILNSVSSNCAVKTAASWRLYYNEYKSKLQKKIKSEKAAVNMSAIGGGPAKEVIFTPLQNRLYGILTRDVGQPLIEVKHIVEMPDNSLSPTPNTSSAGEEKHPTAAPALTPATPLAPPPAAPAPADPPESADEPRRRRRRRQRQASASPPSSVRAVCASLAAVERLGADATRRHARATARLAAAVDRLARALEAGRPPLTAGWGDSRAA